MDFTPYHAKYYAHELTRRCPSDSVEKLVGALVDAQVDLNPHQVEAALFAFRSPLSKGAILADEVGLGKTIEAGLVISQKWAERRRRMLVITPSSLRKQWHQELTEKFALPCRILETKSYNQAVKQGDLRPFESDSIVICSCQFARNKASDVQATPWDLVVIDEAHRLRNVYKPSNVIANTLKKALGNAPKLLLTATPLQNSLLELFGLVSFVDEHAFGDLKSFREQFSHLNNESVFATLKARLQPVCHRTLRRQVLPYVRYTTRLPILQPFTPEEGEDRLYNLVSEYLRRDNLQALPVSQRSLMTLVLRKLLASSTFAIAGALDSLRKRLEDRLRQDAAPPSLEEELDEDYEALDETAEEWSDDENGERPYNTGSAFQHYADGVEHSLWLTLMRDRIALLRQLMSEDGSLWINIDDNECHYLKVMCDEIFGRASFVTSVIWEKADSPRNSARQFSTDHDYVLVYSKNPSWVPRRLPRTQEASFPARNEQVGPVGGQQAVQSGDAGRGGLQDRGVSLRAQRDRVLEARTVERAGLHLRHHAEPQRGPA